MKIYPFFYIYYRLKIAMPLFLNFSLLKSVMETCSEVLTFESVDEILWCDHSNETSLAVLLHGSICFFIFYKIKFGFFYCILSFFGAL